MGDKKPPVPSKKPTTGWDQYSASAVAEAKTSPEMRRLMATHQALQEIKEAKRQLAEDQRRGVPAKRAPKPSNCLQCHRERSKETKWNGRGKWVHDCINADGDNPCPAFASGDINDC